MTDPTPLSPAAQAVLYAIECHCKFTYRSLAAAALRAAAEQVVPALDPDDPGPVLIDAERNRARLRLLAIADELEGAGAE